MAGIALSTAFLAGMAMGWAVLPVVAGGAVLLRLCGLRVHIAWLVALAGVVSLGIWRSGALHDARLAAWPDQITAVHGRVVSGPLETDRLQRFDLAVMGVQAGEWSPASGKVCASAPLTPRVGYGDEITAIGAPEPVSDIRPSLGRTFLARGCIASLQASSVTVMAQGNDWRAWLDRLRRKLTDGLRAAAPGDAGVLLAGLVTGDDQALSDHQRSAFIATGTTHITAVSGSNVALLVVILTGLGAVAGWVRSGAWMSIVAVVIWTYAMMVGLGPPALRAALVATGALLAALLGRRPDPVTLIAVSAALEVAWRPGDMATLAFRLSVGSSLALALAAPAMGEPSRFWWLSSAVRGTAAAQVATLPVLAHSFGTVPLVALVANLLILPVVGVVFPLAFGASVVGLASATIGAALTFPAAVGAWWILTVVDHVSLLPGGVTAVGAQHVGTTVFSTGLTVGVISLLSAEIRQAIARVAAGMRSQPRVAMIAISAVAGALGGMAAMLFVR
ncbi:MAG: hypothetical protein KatS3mg059_0831 [Thermomicrobiales bacterium]|nr:MAG: hypothetical protein KatS3mg059_0831 [Thermomicrobiales bacterium]